MRRIIGTTVWMLVSGASIACCAGEAASGTYRVVETRKIDKVPSWFPVGFCLLTHGEFQYVAYYNDQHQMMVGQRKLAEQHWRQAELPSKVGWDSHNYITMALDAAGDLHLTGNMHCIPLIYFRTRRSGDITTMERLTMTGQDEQRCTYPIFLTDAENDLMFMYRSGGSGNGRRFFNRYDADSKTWRRFLDGPLFEGEGKRNAYPRGPTRGPDGRFHLVWVWRDTPDCATNHHLSYARSNDLENWETAAGEPVRLPLTLEQQPLYVDPIPAGGGVINGCERLAFDSQHRPVISYHKRDENGHMQIYVARFEEQAWTPRPLTAWDKTIDFAGRGAMPFIGIRLSGLRTLGSDRFVIDYRHRDYGSGRIVLDESTLRPVDETIVAPPAYPKELMAPTIDFEGISVRIAQDLGGPADPDTKYVLRWETLGANHDRPRNPPLPPPSVLTLVKLQRAR